MSKYSNLKILGVYNTSYFSSVVILDINDECVVSGFSYDGKISNARSTKIYIDNNDNYYFVRYKTRYYLNDFLRVDYK